MRLNHYESSVKLGPPMPSYSTARAKPRNTSWWPHSMYVPPKTYLRSLTNFKKWLKSAPFNISQQTNHGTYLDDTESTRNRRQTNKHATLKNKTEHCTMRGRTGHGWTAQALTYSVWWIRIGAWDESSTWPLPLLLTINPSINQPTNQ